MSEALPDTVISSKELSHSAHSGCAGAIRECLLTLRHDLSKLARYNRSPLPLLLLSIPVLMVYAVVRYVAGRCKPGPIREAALDLCDREREHLIDPHWARDTVLEWRPLPLIWLCLAPPTALLLMLHYSVKRLVQAIKPPKPPQVREGWLLLRQNVQDAELTRPAFFFSPLFAVSLLAFFASGIPAWISLWLYNYLGVDPLFGHPSHDPLFHEVFVVICLYVYSLGWCLSTLFFRAYFTFPWNFTSTEYDIEISPERIKKLPIKGWFMNVMQMGDAGLCPQRLRWSDVIAVTIESTRADTEVPSLPRTLPGAEAFRSLLSLHKAIREQCDLNYDYLKIETPGRSIDIRLWELTADQKSQLFKCIREYAPCVHLDGAVQEALIGSRMLNDARYTEIWFDVLSSRWQPDGGNLLSAGARLRDGRLVVESRLGAGGQAVVYLASDTATGGKVVLKEFQLTPGEGLSTLIDSAAAFEVESTILSQLDHYGIVKLLDMFFNDSRVYLVLEHVPGKSLRAVANDDGPVSEAKTIELAVQMAEILAYLHNRTPAVIHRDFTPDNLILQSDGKLKLVDFSVAQRLQDVRRGDCAGKHCYTPPEQFRGETVPQSDIYAMGATLYFLLVGKDPEPISRSEPRVARAELSDGINEIIKRATELSTADRYESIEWLLTELRHISDRRP